MSTLTCVAFTVATARTPTSSPSSSAASRDISETTRNGPAWISTWAMTVSRTTRAVPGGRARVVHDRVFKHGRVVEDTLDFYAQDRAGNVWYFGESTKELGPRGRVITREGSWFAGRDGSV